MDQPDYHRAKIILSLVVVALLAAAFFAYRDFIDSRRFRIIFFDVGQGDSALIRLPSGKKILIDCGPDRVTLHKLGRYLNFFERDIDYLVVSHPDRDHYGGCIDVLKRYNVKKIIENGDAEEEGSFWSVWQETAKAEGAERAIINEQYSIKDGEADFVFFGPSRDPAIIKNDNNQSLVIHLRYGTTTVLFTGDVEAEREAELAGLLCPAAGEACPALRSDYFKAAHHGSDSSLNENFFRAVQPKITVISVGVNRFGHPSLRVIRNLERLGALIWRTDKLGDIIIR